jgi:hypothetical protein
MKRSFAETEPEVTMSFHESMRRVITGDNAGGKSVVILDGGPSSMFGDPNLGGLFEIWEDAASGTLDPATRRISARRSRSSARARATCRCAGSS